MTEGLAYLGELVLGGLVGEVVGLAGEVEVVELRVEGRRRLLNFGLNLEVLTIAIGMGVAPGAGPVELSTRVHLAVCLV